MAWNKDLRVKKSLTSSPSLDLKYDTHCKILGPFLKEMQALGKGVNMNINGEMRSFKGAVQCVTGDAPAVGVMSGFKESVGQAHKPCHVCNADHYDMKCIFEEDKFTRRTASEYYKQLSSVTDTSKPLHMQTMHSTLYGINGPSLFSILLHIHPILLFVFELMHILHEGVLEAHLRLLLDLCVNVKKCFTPDDFNSELQLFSQQFLSHDKPAPIKVAHLKSGLRQSAAQMLNLATTLPFILVGKPSVPLENLKNFILLLQIANGLLCYEVRTEEVNRLKQMIQEHNETFMVQYPDFDIPPKFHYLIHLASQLLDSQWTD